MKKLRAVIVGCGMVSEFHLRAWQRIPEVEVVALVDPQAGNAARRLELAPSARIHTTLESALAAGALDFADILSPPDQHAAQCRLAHAGGLHVVCQKPLCDDLAEAVGLVRDLAPGPRLFCVHENHIYRPWFRRVAELHDTAYFGTVRRFRLEQHDPTAPPQRLNREAAHGVLLQYGTHLIDMVRRILGNPLRVRARLERINPDVRGDSLAVVDFDYPDCLATVEVAYKHAAIGQAGVVLVGDRGEACFDGTMIRGGPSRFRLAQGATVERDEERSTVDDYHEAFFLFQRAFVDAVLTGAPPPQPAARNLLTLAMTFAAYAAAERDTPVDFPEFLQTHAINPR